VSLDDDLTAELRALVAVHRARVPRVVDGPQGACVHLDGASVLSFASNDYLGLASDARLVRAATAVAREVGVGAGSSRLIVGNHREHVAFERAVADWLQRDGVQLFNSGYAANTGVLTALLGAGDVVFSDALNHASIVDGCRLSRAEIVVYPHLDYTTLEQKLHQHAGRRRVIVSESLFSMDGDVADTKLLADLASRHHAVLMLDEAHAIGVFGPEGRGLAAEAQVVPDVLIGTCGKALGSFGAFVVGSEALARWLWNRSRSLVFSTALPPLVTAASRVAIEIIRGVEGQERRQRVRRHARALRTQMTEIKGEEESPIAPLIVGDDERAMQISSRLLASGVYVQGIRPPTVPPGTARLRASLTAAHSSHDVDILIEKWKVSRGT
jgi:8-amino-7-oxononanoate synthase